MHPIYLIFIVCAEKKLGKLEGTNKTKLTSKDVLASLSEAREDHMRQLISNTEATSTSSNQTTGTTHSLSTHVYDPWRTHSVSNTTTANTQNEHKDALEGHIEIAQQQHSRNWRWLCCTCCSNQRVTYRRAVHGNVEPLTSLTSEEESAFLLDCDELGLTWGNDGKSR